MICHECGTQNREGRKFCSECGARLAIPCTSCGAPNQPGEKFCGECGAALGHGSSVAGSQPGSTPSPLPGPVAERRLVTVLFADLVGFTTLAEQRDPEEVRELLTQYFDLARQDIARYGGTVEKFIGDAVMAVWGTPVAHEDDAERAVRAALELVDAVVNLGSKVGMPDLRLRAGVLTGEAAVTLGAQGQGMVAGDLVNTASRLQSAASPGTVLAGRSTYLAANRAIAFEKAGLHSVKGKELPVEAYRALRVIAGHQGFRRTDQLEPPFVGRDGELRLLKDLFNACAGEKRPHLVSLTGIAGIGKSRLAWEFFKYIDGFVEVVYWHQGRCPAYGEGVTFWALGEMVRMRARIAETEDAVASRAKLAETVAQHVSDIEEQKWIESRLAHLLGLEDVTVNQREELFAAWRSFFEHISEEGPTVLLFEDLQWADQGLIDFIEYMLEWVRNNPIFIVVLARPELSDKRPTWGAAHRNFTSISLEPVDEDAMTQLLQGLVGDLPGETLQQVVERAEGVPLYAVETIRMLVDQSSLVFEDGGYRVAGPVTELAIPDTLHALIAARLDALAAKDRTLLQDASILGKTFTLQALGGVTTQASDELNVRLRGLVRKELLEIESDPRSPERGQYGFVGGLVREVAYHTLSRDDRKTRHLAAAHYFEASGGDEELASVVATHYIEAYRATPEGPEAEALAARARDSLVVAADRAASLGSHEQALAYLEQALAVMPSAEERVFLLEKAAASAAAQGANQRAELYLKEAIAWHERTGDRWAAARAMAHLGHVLLMESYVDQAIERLERALELLPADDLNAAMVEVASELGRSHMIGGRPELALEWADRALAGAEALDLVPFIAESLVTKGVAASLLGRWREASVLLLGAGALAEEHGLVAQELRARSNTAFLLVRIDPVRGLESAKKSLELAHMLGQAEWVATAASNCAWSAFYMGEWAWARDTLAEAYRDGLPLATEGLLVCVSALLEGMRGDPSISVARFNEIASDLVASSSAPQDVAEVNLVRGWIALAEGRFKDAHEQGMLAVEADPTGPSGTQGLLVATRAALWLRDRAGAEAAARACAAIPGHGQWMGCFRATVEASLFALDDRLEEATRSFGRAIEGWRSLGTVLDLALCQLDFFTLLGPEHPDALAAAHESREIFARLGAKPFLERLAAAQSALSVGKDELLS
jgi:class 3 adenylate cyclase/tetratricopeptide (TPR) repeat protein